VSFVDVSFVDVSFTDVLFVDVSFVDVSFVDVSLVDVSFVDVCLICRCVIWKKVDVSFVDVSFVDVSFVDVLFVDFRAVLLYYPPWCYPWYRVDTKTKRHQIKNAAPTNQPLRAVSILLSRPSLAAPQRSPPSSTPCRAPQPLVCICVPELCLCS
jgi:hypothetical protein